MKKHLNLFLISLLVWGCNPKNVEPASEFEITTMQSKVYSGLTIEVISAQNSLCPPDGNCIWQGFANAKIIVKSNSSSQSQEIDFCVGGCIAVNQNISTENTFVMDRKRYKLTLVDLLRTNGFASNPVTVRLKIE